ncbi:MAG: ATP-binding cassette domain-containing protein [Nanoarchaeota archaeon]
MSKKAISVSHLTKRFDAKLKEPGFWNSVRSIVRPKFKRIDAVKNLSFDVGEGEILAFIGPNGAGKSTTIKMLTGILYPTSGSAKVMGFTPWSQRKKMAYRVGCIFGQKPQLWYHLPAQDTFDLLAKIYDLDEGSYQKRVKELIEQFDIAEIVKIPVRKLSLGQRMRCEIVGSLIHKPDVLFLDEPTIGLDVVAKARIRSIIKKMNEKEGTTIILTSHDMGDIEKLCKRAIIINEGKMIYDGKLSALRRKYIKVKTINAKFSDRVLPIKIPGVTVLKQVDFGAKLEVDLKKAKVGDVLAALNKFPVEDITITDPEMEEIIAMIYGKHGH